MPFTVTEQVFLAVACEEGWVPPLEDYVQAASEEQGFRASLGWSGASRDEAKEIPTREPNRAIVGVTHLVPRFTACQPRELGDAWCSAKPLLRITTMAFEDGQADHVVDASF